MDSGVLYVKDNFEKSIEICRDIPYTRIIEHKYFDLNDKQTKTYISKEYPSEYKEGMEPYYPVNNEKNYFYIMNILNLQRKKRTSASKVD